MGAGPGAFGPYRHGHKFRVIVRAESAGPAVYESFESENAARQFIEDYRELHGTQIRRISEAIDSYAEHLADKGNSERSCTETPQKLRQFFEPSIDDALEILTHARCERLYDRVTKLKRTKAGPNKTRVETEHTIAAATHRQWLLEARSFTRW